MFELLRKDYEIDVLWQTLKYEQATLYECMEFSYEMKQEWFDMLEWLVVFLQEKIEIKEKDILKIDIQKLIDVLMSTRFKGYFSEWESDWKGSPFESYILTISDKFYIDPDTLIKRYTPEQLAKYAEWLLYNANEQTKEGKQRNRFNAERKEVKQWIDMEERLKIAKELEEKMKNS